MNVVNLQINKDIQTMLGIKTRRVPIGGDIANEIRSAVVRVATKQLNDSEKASVERSKHLRKKYKATWKDINGRSL